MPLASLTEAKPLGRAWMARCLRLGLGLRQHPRQQRTSLGLGLWLALVVATSGAAAPGTGLAPHGRRLPMPQPTATPASTAPIRPAIALPARAVAASPRPIARASSSAPPPREALGPAAPSAKPLPASPGQAEALGPFLPALRLVRGPGKAGGSPKRRPQPMVASQPTPAPVATPSPSPTALPQALPSPSRPGVAVVERLAWRGFGLVIQADAPLSPDAFTLHGPERFVVDLPNTEFGEPDQARSLSVQAAGVRQVRMAAQAGGGVRLVLDVADAGRYRVVQFADRKALVIARSEEPNARLAELMRGEGAPPGQGVQIARAALRHQGERVELELVAPKPFKLELKDARPTQLVLRLPGARFTGLFGPPGGEVVQSARARTGGDGALELALGLKPGHYQLSRSSEQGGKVQRLSWWRVEPRGFAGRPLVVIDPGHGGNDPGALGPGGITEKAVCLNLALAFQQALRAKRINALLTRSCDEEVLLAPRLAMIDQVGADAFVSIHANAHAAGSEGLESYWREPPSRPLATAMQGAIVSALGRPDRGVKHERLYVLRHQRVPSTLVEVGFITNPREAAWMATPGFRQKATVGLVAGLERFWAQAPQNLGVLPLGLPLVGGAGLGLLGGLEAP